MSRNDVLAVMTPACDLQRDGAKRVMLLVGTLKPLTARDWSYEDDPVRTPVVELDGERFWIKWNLKHVDMIAPATLAKAVAEGGLEVMARLRESHALELQQKMLHGYLDLLLAGQASVGRTARAAEDALPKSREG